MSLTLFFFPEFSWLENFGWGANPIISNCGRNRFIKTILHPASPKCLETKNPKNVGLIIYFSSTILYFHHKTNINKITEIVIIDKMNTYGSILIIAKFRNISAVSLTFGKGISGTSTLRNSHKGPQPSFT